MIIIDPTAIIADPISFTFVDYPEPSATAMVVYFFGCDHNCAGCHNPELQSQFPKKNPFKVYTPKTLFETLIELAEKHRTTNVIFSGGDPLHPENRTFVRHFLGLNNGNLGVCVFTGYDENYAKNWEINDFDYLKTGTYIETLKQQSVKTDRVYQLASQNQKLFGRDYKLLTNPTGAYYFNEGENTKI